MPATIIAVSIQKGGSGKTTTTVNLAHALAYKPLKKKVLVIDMDPQSNATSTLAPVPFHRIERTIMDIFLNDDIKLSACISPTKIKGVDMIASTLDAFKLKTKLNPSSPKQIMALKFKLDEDPSVLEYYDYILLDCQPDITGPFVANSLVTADYVLIPLSSESHFGLQGVDLFLSAVDEYKKVNPKIKLLGTVITFFDGRTIASSTMEAQILSFFGKEAVFNTRISRSTTVSRAEIAKKTCIQLDTRLQGSVDYRNLAAEVIYRITGEVIAISDSDSE